MDKKKSVDESWKEQASEEKSKMDDVSGEALEGSDSTAAESGTPEAYDTEINFLNYITSLGFQAMIFMGVIPNPITDKTEKNLTQAKFRVDTLIMLK